MSPIPFPHESGSEGPDEVMELQNTAHYSSNTPNRPATSLFGSLNSVLLSVRSGDNYNGSQTGSANGLSQNSLQGSGAQGEESDLAVLLALFVPLAVTVTAIFIIALFVRRMRRTESMHEVDHSSNNKNEFQMAVRRKKVSAQSNDSAMSSASSTSSHPSLTLSPSVKGSSTSYKSHQFGNYSSSGSIYRHSSYVGGSSHLHLKYQSSLPAGLGTGTSPAGLAPPPWPLAPTIGFYYARSHYGLNKLHQQLYQQASLQFSSSMQNLSGSALSHTQSLPPHQADSFCTQSDPELEGVSGDETKKSSHKKLKRVLSAMNFPRRIKQYQADKKRFNVYTVPVETREQLKHIYVY